MLKFRKRTLALFTATAITIGGGGFAAVSVAQAANNTPHGKALGRATATATPSPTSTTTSSPTPTLTPSPVATSTTATPTATPTTATPTPTTTATATQTSAPATTDVTGTEAAQSQGWGPLQAGDEFNYAGAPDSTKWGVYNSAGHAGNGLRVPQAINVNNGMMTISGNSDGVTGGMSAKFGRQKYGRYEVRMRTSAAEPQYHAVSILWPDASSAKCSEIDFAEQTNDLANISFFLHYGCATGVQTYAKKPLDLTQWHNYAVQWCPSGVTGFVDGQPWFKDTDPAHQPDQSMHLTLQLDWFPVSGQTTKPSTMDVDWARNYSINGTGSPASGTLATTPQC